MSEDETLVVLICLVFAAKLERPVVPYGVLPALLYLGLGVAAVEMAGPWV
jgi:hypothetical protein